MEEGTTQGRRGKQEGSEQKDLQLVHPPPRLYVTGFCFCLQTQEFPAVLKKTEISSKSGMVSEKPPIFETYYWRGFIQRGPIPLNRKHV